MDDYDTMVVTARQLWLQASDDCGQPPGEPAFDQTYDAMCQLLREEAVRRGLGAEARYELYDAVIGFD